MAGNRIDIAQMETTCLTFFSDTDLIEEEHRQVHIRVEVDVHGQLETINRQLIDSLSLADCVIVDENVNGSMVPQNAFPG